MFCLVPREIVETSLLRNVFGFYPPLNLNGKFAQWVGSGNALPLSQPGYSCESIAEDRVLCMIFDVCLLKACFLFSNCFSAKNANTRNKNYDLCNNYFKPLQRSLSMFLTWNEKALEVFTNCPQYRNDSIGNFVLALLLEMTKINKDYNLKIPTSKTRSYLMSHLLTPSGAN